MSKTKMLVVLVALLASAPAFAADGCTFSLHPTTSGFFLNPTLQKVVVVKATSNLPDKPCTLFVNDELLQINAQVIPGASARAVMSYWKSIPKGTDRIFKVRRAGSVISVVSK